MTDIIMESFLKEENDEKDNIEIDCKITKCKPEEYPNIPVPKVPEKKTEEKNDGGGGGGSGGNPGWWTDCSEVCTTTCTKNGACTTKCKWVCT